MPERFIPAPIGFGHAVGEHTVTNADMTRFINRARPQDDQIPERVFERMMRAVGIQERHWVRSPDEVELNNRDNQEASSDLATRALLEALQVADVKKKDLKALYVASSTPDFLGVSVAAMVQAKADLPRDIFYSNNADACSGLLIAWRLGYQNLSSPYGTGGPIAIVGVETLSTNLSERKSETSAVFGDASGAIVLDVVKVDPGAPTGVGFANGADGSLAENLRLMAGGSKYPTTHETVDRDYHSLDMDGEIIKEAANTNMPIVAKKAMEKAGYTLADIAYAIPHQANLLIIKKVAETMGVPMEKVIVTINQYGNTSSASIPTALYQATNSGIIKRNDVIVCMSFGAGVEYAGLAVPMVGLPK